jgi:hypothetical protein
MYLPALRRLLGQNTFFVTFERYVTNLRGTFVLVPISTYPNAEPHNFLRSYKAIDSFFKTVFYSSSDASLAEILFLYDTQSNILAPFR